MAKRFIYATMIIAPVSERDTISGPKFCLDVLRYLRTLVEFCRRMISNQEVARRLLIMMQMGGKHKVLAYYRRGLCFPSPRKLEKAILLQWLLNKFLVVSLPSISHLSIPTSSHSVREHDSAAPHSEPSHERDSDGGISVGRLTSTALVDPSMNAQIPSFTYIRQVVDVFQTSVPVANNLDMLWSVAGRKHARSAQVTSAGHEAHQPLVSCASSLRRPSGRSGCGLGEDPTLILPHLVRCHFKTRGWWSWRRNGWAREPWLLWRLWS